MTSGIYSITHVDSGKRYIGQSIDVEDRLSHHRQQLQSGRHKNAKLARAVARHGLDAFRFEVLVAVAPSMLTFYEQRLMDGYDAVKNGYNIAPAAESVRGITRSAEVRARVSSAKKAACACPEYRAARSMLTKKLMQRPELVAEIAAATKAAMARPEVRTKYMDAISSESFRAAKLERTRRPEFRAAVAAKVKASYESQEVRDRHRAACSTPEYRAKIAASNASPERKAGRAEAARAGWLKRKAAK